MKEKRILNALEQVDEKYIEDASPAKRKSKKPIWIKCVAAAACIVLVAVVVIPVLNNMSKPQEEEEPIIVDAGEGPAEESDYTEIISVNGKEYVVYGESDKDVLTEYGIPTELTEEIAGEHVCYLAESNHIYSPVEKADSTIEDNAIELFELAPIPNENIFVMCRDGAYFVAISK